MSEQNESAVEKRWKRTSERKGISYKRGVLKLDKGGRERNGDVGNKRERDGVTLTIQVNGILSRG